MSTEYEARVVGYTEECRIVMHVHKSREDSMGDTTRDVVLAMKSKPIPESHLQHAIERCK